MTNEEAAREIVRSILNNIVFNGGNVTRDHLASGIVDSLAEVELIAPDVPVNGCPGCTAAGACDEQT